MTLPNGLDGITSAIGTLWATTGGSGLGGATAANPISSMANLTQTFVTDFLRGPEGPIQTSPGWNNASTDVWSGLRSGISLPLAIIEGIVNNLFGTNIDFLNVDHVLSAIEQVPVIGDLISIVEAMVNAMGGVLTGSESLPQLAAAVEAALKNIPGLNIVSALLGSVIPGLDASKITSGTFADALVPGLGSLMGAITSALGGSGNTSSAVATALKNIPGLNIVSALLGTVIPGLDASKITSGTFADALIPGLGSLMGAITSALGGTGSTSSAVSTALSNIPGLNIVGTLLSGVIPGLDASKITSGSFAQSMVSGLTSTLATFLSSGSPLNAANLTGLLASMIPSLDASKITSGTFAQSMISGLTSTLATFLSSGSPLNAANLTGLLASMIPSLDASKITSGTFAQSMISGLSSTLAGFLTSGSSLDAGNLIGTLAATIIPGLDASKITSGTFSQSMVSGLTTSLANAGGAFADAIFQAINGGTTTGVSAAQVKSALQAIPGANIASAIAASLIPGLDASKITSGTFAQSMITGLSSTLAGFLTSSSSLNAANLTGLVSSLIPSLDASKITTGTFPQSMLNITSIASSLLTGVLGVGLIPGLDASKITSGTFPQSMLSITSIASSLLTGVLGAGLIPGLDASKITSGVLGASQVPDVTLGMSSAIQSLVDQTYQVTQGSSATGNLLSSFGSSFGGLLDGLNNNITGVSASGSSNANVSAAVAGQAATLTGLATQVAQLQAAAGTGTKDADTFERTVAGSLAPGWNVYQTGTGTVAIPDGHSASLAASAACEFVARRTTAVALTDNPTVQMVLGSASQSWPWPLLPIVFGHNDIWLRMSAFTTWATRTGVRFRWGADGLVTCHAVVNGVETKIYPTSGTVNKGNPPSGAILQLAAGVGGTARRFVASVNGSPIVDFTEVGTTSQLGSTFRNRGFGGKAENSLLLTALPGNVATWTGTG